MNLPRRAPAFHVLDAFGVARGSLEPLPDRHGMTWRAEDLVLRPGAEERWVRWEHEVTGAFADDPGSVVLRPVPARDGRLVVGGWWARRWFEGAAQPVDVDALLGVSASFHRRSAGVPCPPFVLGRTDRAASAERMAWGEEALSRYAPRVLRSLVGELGGVLDDPWRGPPTQLIHTTIAGHTFFAEAGAPGVVDLAPSWRPAAYADALVVADAVVTHRADEAHAASFVAERQHGSQLLIRAALARAAADPDQADAWCDLIRMAV